MISLVWETYPGNTPLDGGKIYPGKTTFDDTSPDRRKVRVKATITPTAENIHVYFSWWDVDDPSSNTSPIDANGSTGNDNKGSGETLSATSAVTDGSGDARVTFTVTLNPGDNYRIAASCSSSQLGQMTQAMADSGNPPTGVVLSNILTTWRKLWIERDSMDAVASSGAEKNYVSGTAIQYERLSPEFPARTKVYLGQNLPSEFDDNDQFNPGWYHVSGRTYLVYANSSHWLEGDYIIVMGDPNQDGAGYAYDLYDDDYSLSLQVKVTLPAYPSLGSYSNEFEKAYIKPVYLSSPDPDVISFDRNMAIGDVGWSAIFDNTPSSGFWSVLSLAAFQPITSQDADGETSTWLGEAHMGDNYLALYLEVIENEAGKSDDKIMAHEVGHTAGLDDCESPDCILNTQGSNSNFCDNCIAYMRGKDTIW